MKTMMLNIPDTLDMDNGQLAMLVASQFYEQGKLSLGQAAEVAGLTKRTFAELLGNYNVSIFNFPASDLSKNVNNNEKIFVILKRKSMNLYLFLHTLIERMHG
jgi:predicted HTH domain antitoxin